MQQHADLFHNEELKRHFNGKLFNGFDFLELGGLYFDPERFPNRILDLGYHEGSLPVAEATAPQLISIPAFAYPPAGLLDQYIASFRKVCAHLDQLAEQPVAVG